MTADREAAIREAGKRLLNKRRLGSFYLDDVKLLLAELAAAREEIARQIELRIEDEPTALRRAAEREEKLREALLMLRHDPEYADWTTKGQRRIVDEALEISAEGGTTGHGTAAAATAGSDGEGAPSQSEVGADTALSEGEGLGWNRRTGKYDRR